MDVLELLSDDRSYSAQEGRDRLILLSIISQVLCD
jgi:hypothetical protein